MDTWRNNDDRCKICEGGIRTSPQGMPHIFQPRCVDPVVLWARATRRFILKGKSGELYKYVAVGGGDMLSPN